MSLPSNFKSFVEQFPEVAKAHEELGKSVRSAGPLDEKTAHLIQLGAAIAIQSEGAVHSHVRRAKEAGATKEEILHVVLLQTSTLGFPRTAAAYSWVQKEL